MEYYSETSGDVFLLHKGIVAHGCNAQGVMGSGIALTIKNEYPSVFKSYRDLYVSQECQLHLGQAQRVKVDENLTIYNLITQNNFGSPKYRTRWVSYDAIDVSFRAMFLDILDNDIGNQHVTIPLIGAGLGGGDWNIISTIIKTAASELKIPVTAVHYKKVYSNTI